MKKEPTILKQMLALLLLAVFLFIHVVKILHDHHDADAAQHVAGVSNVIKSADCAVCDYHLAKDVLADVVYHAQPSLILHSSYIISHRDEPVSSIGLCYSDRGPPSA